MTDIITTSGLVATVPRHVTTAEGLPITSFRLAAGQRKFNRTTKAWEYGDTNWYTVTAFRQLAINLVGSVAKGDRVVVTGRLRIREWENEERSGTVIEIDADAVGHDLNWGTSSYARSVKSSAAGSEAEHSEADHDDGPTDENTAFDPDEASGASGADKGGWATTEEDSLVVA
ncbi:MAG: single-strand DNA-binding protein [Microbacteriaceae bacterium]|jgi:single-strand DNA-binding protein|nr:single-strand DNA-binding protein [Microbacteriaceae bacterium]